MDSNIDELGIITFNKLRKIKTLPTIPKVMLEVSKILKKQNSNISELTEVIGKDQGLTTKVLAIANSPLYGLPKNVSSLEFGIMILGMNEVSNIVTALSLAQATRGDEVEGFDYMEFWTHSMLVGTASKDIAHRLGFAEIAGDAFVAGMLHDIGIQLTARYFPEEFKTIAKFVDESTINFYEAELKVLGATHENIGHFIITKWNLPENLAEVINYHHHPRNLDKQNMALNIVHLADTMTKLFEIGNFSWDMGIEFDETIIEPLGFDNKQDLDKFIEEYYEVFQDTADTIKL